MAPIWSPVTGGYLVVVGLLSLRFLSAALVFPRPPTGITTTANSLIITDLTVNEYDNVTLPCPVSPGDKRIIFWSHYVMPMGTTTQNTSLFFGPADLIKNARFSLLPGSALHISPTRTEDVGFFACAMPGQQPAASYRLMVTEARFSPTVESVALTAFPGKFEMKTGQFFAKMFRFFIEIF